MHPAIGPWAEAQRLYVDPSQLASRLADSQDPVRLYDVGLGAGTNAVASLTAAQAAGGRARLELVSFERDLEPLELALGDPLGFPFLVPWAEAARELVRRGEWRGEQATWILALGELPSTLSHAPIPVDLVFFDPFSPKTNPDLWTVDVLRRLRQSARVGGRGCQLFTYSAATPTRVTLLLAGWYVGIGTSVGTKRETTVASTALGELARPLEKKWLQRWRRSSAPFPHGSQIPDLEAQLVSHPQFR